MVFSASSGEYIGSDLSDTPFFRQALSGKVTTGEASFDKVTGRLTIPVASPVYSEAGAIVGALVDIVDISMLTDQIAKVKMGRTGYAFALNGEGFFIAHPVKEKILAQNALTVNGFEVFARNMTDGKKGIDDYVFEGVAKKAAYAPSALTGWSIGISIPKVELSAAANAIRNWILVVSGIAFLLAFLFFFLFARSISRPLGVAVSHLGEMAQGDLRNDIPPVYLKRSDEIGGLAKALDNLSKDLRRIVEDITWPMPEWPAPAWPIPTRRAPGRVPARRPSRWPRDRQARPATLTSRSSDKGPNGTGVFNVGDVGIPVKAAS